MDDDRYQDFIKNFKVALTNCSIYFLSHPIFIKSIKELKKKIEDLLAEKDFFSIKIKPNTLIVDSKDLSKIALSKGLADSLHRKKIKIIIFEKGFTSEGLSNFLLVVSASEKEILSRGGVSKILKNKKIEKIKVKELDYSQLLRGKGKAVKDIWGYLLNEEESGHKNNNTDKYGLKEVLKDERLSKKLVNSFLKNAGNDKDKLKKLFKLENKKKFKEIFSSLSPEDLTKLLLKLFKTNQGIEPSTFNLFSSLVPIDVHKKTAEMLGEAVNKEKENINFKKIRDLLSSSQEEGAIPIYRKNLQLDVGGKNSKGKKYLDYKQLDDNYRLILLDLLFYENNTQRLKIITEKICQELKNNFRENLDYVTDFVNIYKKKLQDSSFNKELFDKAYTIFQQAEAEIFNNDQFYKFSFLFEVLKSSTLDSEFYLNKIEENKFNSLTLKLYFKFFPQRINKLYKKIREKQSDSVFLKKMIDSLQNIKNPFAADILKYLFNLTTVFGKVKVLEGLENKDQIDEDFLFSILTDKSFYLRKKAAEVVSNFKQLHKQLAKELLLIKNILGINSRFILENLRIVSRFYIPEARPYLEKLSKYKFFWNKKIRKKAREVLNSYDAK